MRNRIWLMVVAALGLAVLSLTVLAQGPAPTGAGQAPAPGDVVVDRYGRPRLLDRHALVAPPDGLPSSAEAPASGDRRQAAACSVLVVDDDWEWDNVQPNDGGRPYYTTALEALGLGYDVWDVVEVGEPTYGLVSGYDVVIWFTGYAWEEVFKSSNETVMAQYLDGGGRLLLSSQDYFYDADDITPFMLNYLGIGWMQDDVVVTTTVGISGTPVGDGLGPYTLVRPDDYFVYWPQGALQGPTDDEATARAGAFEPFRYASPWNTSANATAHYSDTFQTLFLAWPLEWVDTVGQRAQVLGVALDWMGCDLPPLVAPDLSPIDNSDGNAEYWVEWGSVTGATGYLLEEDDDPEFSSPVPRYDGPESRFEVAQQVLGTWYYRVRARQPGAESATSSVEAATVILLAPDAPQIVPIDNADGDGDYLVDWNDVPGAEEYTLEEDDNPLFYSPEERYSGAGSQFQFAGHRAGVWYYRARATGPGGRSLWSEVASVAVLPPAPFLLPISNPDGDGKYWVDWQDVEGASSYTLQEDDNPGFATPVVRYSGAVSRYQVTGRPGGVWYYRALASNPAGDGPWSNVEAVQVKPAAPTLYQIYNGDGDGDYLVDWSEPLGATGYTLQRDDSPLFPSPDVAYAGEASQFQVVGQLPGTWYYRALASNGAGDSPWSAVQPVPVFSGPVVLLPIENPEGGGEYLVDWTEVTGATSYTLEEDDEPSFSLPTVRYRGGESQLQITGQPDGVWYYRARPSNVAGFGPWSNIESAKVGLRQFLFLPVILRNP